MSCFPLLLLCCVVFVLHRVFGFAGPILGSHSLINKLNDNTTVALVASPPPIEAVPVVCACFCRVCVSVVCCPVAHVACVFAVYEYMCVFSHLTLMPDFPHNKPTTEQTRTGPVHVLASVMNSGLTQVSVVQMCARVFVWYRLCSPFISLPAIGD